MEGWMDEWKGKDTVSIAVIPLENGAHTFAVQQQLL